MGDTTIINLGNLQLLKFTRKQSSHSLFHKVNRGMSSSLFMLNLTWKGLLGELPDLITHLEWIFITLQFLGKQSQITRKPFTTQFSVLSRKQL